MSEIGQILERAAADLKRLKARFTLVGGMAVSVWREPRLTRDVDLALSVAADSEAESLVRDLIGMGYRVLAQVEQTSTGRLATVRLSPPGQPPGIVLDLLFASSGIESKIVEQARLVQVTARAELPVARPSHLVALKVLARDDRRRPQDVIDLRALLHGMEPAEVEDARTALKHIQERGFHRGRNLLEDFEELLRDRPA